MPRSEPSRPDPIARLYITGYTAQEHDALLSYHHQGLAPSTIRTRRSQAEAYVTFMVQHDADPICPELYDVLQYISFLLSKCASIQTVKNKLSGARSWVEEVGGDLETFSARAVTLTLRGGARASSHVPRRAPAITPTILRQIVDFLTLAGRPGVVPIAALLMGFLTMLRQSNLIFPSARSWGGAQHHPPLGCVRHPRRPKGID